MFIGAILLTPNQVARLEAVRAVGEHTQIDVTWWIYQLVVAAYRGSYKVRGRARMQVVITSLSTGVSAALLELTALDRNLKRRATDVLANF